MSAGGDMGLRGRLLAYLFALACLAVIGAGILAFAWLMNTVLPPGP